MATKEEFKKIYLSENTSEIDSLIAGRFWAKVPDEDPLLSALIEIINERMASGVLGSETTVNA